MNLESNIFLEEITKKIKQKIASVEVQFSEGQKDIENMNDYYWENYAEMDEYGYEIYDNQQALLRQVNANQEILLQKQRLKHMLDSPFFGRVDFIYDGEEEAEKFYIGIANFAENTGMTPLIYDWRAPVSGLFYDYDKGPAFYEAPAGTINGEIESKWQYKIKDGKMIYAFESDVKIDDEILKQELGNNGDVQLKNIVRTIQKEQNEIIRNTKDKIMVIQGAAGSGKTSIALHRIAYLLYHDREHLKSSNILILSPNSVFSDYISHILPELGEENIKEMSFDVFAYRELKGVVSDCEDRYDQIEQRLRSSDEEIRKRYKQKQTFEFIGQTESFLARLEDSLMDFHEVRFRDLCKTEDELIHLFYFKFQNTPILSRMDAIMEYWIDEIETLRGKNIREEEQEFIRMQFDSMYLTKDVYEIYNWLMEDLGYPTLAKVPPEQRKLRYEDVFPMLYLKYRLIGKTQKKQIKHLVIDEMQDYSYLQYVLLQYLFSCRMTILGDKAQTMDEETQDVLTFLPKIFGRDIRRIVLNKSYRNTVEIARYAEEITGVSDIELFERHGKEVEEVRCQNVNEVLKDVFQKLNLNEDGFETAAIITRTEQEAKKLYKKLKAEGKTVSYIDRNSSAFKKGLTVTTFYLAKGLEFDQVFAIGTTADSPLYRQADYICATRALHELYMYRITQKL